jgi:3-methyladenine DNA glycosylase AlkD
MEVAPPDEALLTTMRTALREAGDPRVAPGQQAYMKSVMPYYGITAPRLKLVLRPILASYAPADRAIWEATVRALWDGATHREERYAALAIARHRAARRWQDPRSLELYRHLVVTGAWWDLVDEVASHLVGAVLAGHREEVTPTMRAWARDGDLWVRRTAVLSQLGHKSGTDTGLLRDVVEANLEDRSFWLRKAIGWALREYARTDPEWVRAEVDALGDRLSGLSRREATRHLG